MRISVLIPAHNCEATIQEALESVFRQTTRPDEILVFNDGSTDLTLSLLDSYGEKIKVFSEPNGGVANARNRLVARSRGDLVAFLDSDDIWHPRYLEAQWNAFQHNPTAALFFTGHFNFEGYGRFQWDEDLRDCHSGAELIEPLEFLRRYNDTTGFFASMSYCCIRRRALLDIGSDPFKLDGVEDSYLCTLIPVLGWSAVYNPQRLAAYRIINGSLSTNRLRAFGRWVEVFKTLAERYVESGNASLRREFEVAFASQRRAYAKLLMGAGRTSDARRQLALSLTITRNPGSIAKSLAFLLQTHLPTRLQPTWPPSYREWKGSEEIVSDFVKTDQENT
jgi:glycosyltransferase involved in cell wall biosynthesis